MNQVPGMHLPPPYIYSYTSHKYIEMEPLLSLSSVLGSNLVIVPLTITGDYSK